MTDMHTFFMATHGCKINQYETQALREVWLARGFSEVETVEAASVVLVNSCAVTAKAVREMRGFVRQVHRANPAARIIVTGCAAQVQREELSMLPGVSYVVPQEAKASLKTWPAMPETISDAAADDAFQSFPVFSVSGSDRARAVVKVQDGCSHRCTYCIVPLTRGRSRSRALDEIVSEARSLLESGFREIILSGVNLRQFGRDLSGTPDFWDLITLLESSLGPDWLDTERGSTPRFRLSSLEPGQLDSRALDTLAASRLVAPQLHISMQSGSNSVLKRMGRGHYTVQPLLRFLEDLRSVWPVYGLGADILMGFPAETEDEFAETLDIVQAMPLTYAHVFPYSRRPGTAASAMPGQLDKQVKAMRAKAVRDLVQMKKNLFFQSLITTQQPLDVVLESVASRNGISQFYTECRFTELPPEAERRGLYRGIAVEMRKSCLLVRPESSVQSRVK